MPTVTDADALLSRHLAGQVLTVLRGQPAAIAMTALSQAQGTIIGMLVRPDGLPEALRVTAAATQEFATEAALICAEMETATC